MLKVQQTIHVHHPALLRIAEVTPFGDRLILDNLSSLAEERIEQDVIFHLPCPASIRVTILTGKRYTYTIPVIAMPPQVYIEHLDDILDVEVPSPGDGYQLAWDAALALWIAKAPPVDYTPKPHADTHKYLASDALDIKDLFFTMLNSFFYRIWGTANGWTESKSGSGSIIYDRIFVNLSTGATSGSKACIYCDTALWLATQQGYLFRFATTLWFTQTNNQEAYIGAFTNPTAPTATEKHIAFKVLNNAVYATNANGSNQTITDTGLSVEQARDKLWFIKCTTTSILFYINNVLVATHTTNIPTNFNAKITLHIKNTAAQNNSLFGYPLIFARAA